MALVLPAALNVATYVCNPLGVVNVGTTAGTVTSLMYLWHTATNTKRIEIYRITASSTGGTAGVFTMKGAFITAENGTPGGTTVTAQQIDQDDPASTLASTTGICRFGAAIPTRITTGGIVQNVFSECCGGSQAGQQYVLFNAVQSGKPIVLRAGQAEGFEVRGHIDTAQTTSAQVSVNFLWTEV